MKLRTVHVACFLAPLTAVACWDWSSLEKPSPVSAADASPSFDVARTDDAAAPGDAARLPFCANQPQAPDGGNRFCDDFDETPDGSGTFVGWTQYYNGGAVGAYTPGGLSLPWAYGVRVPKGITYSEGYLSHQVASVRSFRASFMMKGKQPGASGLNVAVLDFYNPGYTVFLELLGPPQANRVYISQRREVRTADGGTRYESGPDLPIEGTAGVREDAWTKVVLEIDFTAATPMLRCQFGDKSAQVQAYAPQAGPTPLFLRLGPILGNYPPGLPDALDIFYDDVLIESTR